MTPVLIANVLTVTFVYCTASPKTREESRGEGGRKRLIILVLWVLGPGEMKAAARSTLRAAKATAFLCSSSLSPNGSCPVGGLQHRTHSTQRFF